MISKYLERPWCDWRIKLLIVFNFYQLKFKFKWPYVSSTFCIGLLKPKQEDRKIFQACSLATYHIFLLPILCELQNSHSISTVHTRDSEHNCLYVNFHWMKQGKWTCGGNWWGKYVQTLEFFRVLNTTFWGKMVIFSPQNIQILYSINLKLRGVNAGELW